MKNQGLVDWFFSERVFGWMCTDTRRAIDAHENYLVALGLSVYTEVLGGLITGKLASRDKGQTKRNYKAFLKWMGDPCEKMADILYEKVRCGLVHEYFIKAPSAIVIELTDETHSRVPGVFQRPDGLVIFACENYLRDFRRAALRYYSELKRGNHLKEFVLALKELQKR